MSKTGILGLVAFGAVLLGHGQLGAILATVKHGLRAVGVW